MIVSFGSLAHTRRNGVAFVAASHVTRSPRSASVAACSPMRFWRSKASWTASGQTSRLSLRRFSSEARFTRPKSSAWKRGQWAFLKLQPRESSTTNCRPV